MFRSLGPLIRSMLIGAVEQYAHANVEKAAVEPELDTARAREVSQSLKSVPRISSDLVQKILTRWAQIDFLSLDRTKE